MADLMSAENYGFRPVAEEMSFKEQNIISVAVTNRQAPTPNSVGIKLFKLEGSKDGTGFTSLGEFRFAITNNAQAFQSPPQMHTVI